MNELKDHPIKKAIISVYDKKGIVEFAKSLSGMDIDIYSTGGTLAQLNQENVKAYSIEEYIQFPEILSGRVKTLHPFIHGGILARREKKEDVQSSKEHGFFLFDLVCINLYPFEEFIHSQENWSDNSFFEKAIEMIDIGGPTMIRAAAKNHHNVFILTDPSQYSTFIEEYKNSRGNPSDIYRRKLAADAFAYTTSYDSIIDYFFSTILQKQDKEIDSFKDKSKKNFCIVKKEELRYGENPHQRSFLYLPHYQKQLPWDVLHGKKLSYNNLLDMDAVFNLHFDFEHPLCAIFKHTNPCGVAIDEDQPVSLKKAMQSDSISYFGGIVFFNRKITKDTASILIQNFLDVIVAPDYDSESLQILTTKKNLILVRYHPEKLDQVKQNKHRLVGNVFGFLYQESNRVTLDKEKIKIVSQKKPSSEDIEELEFAWIIAKHVKSNAIVLSKNKQTIGIGAGQMSRLDSIKIAFQKDKENKKEAKESYLASDAFFPFRDSIDLAAKEGVKAIIQPGGSIRDQEVIDAANENEIIMIFTGLRHFRH